MGLRSVVLALALGIAMAGCTRSSPGPTYATAPDAKRAGYTRRVPFKSLAAGFLLLAASACSTQKPLFRADGYHNSPTSLTREFPTSTPS